MTEPGYLVTHREEVDARHVRIHFRLDDGRRRPVMILKANDTADRVDAIGRALAADAVMSKEEKRRRGLGPSR